MGWGTRARTRWVAAFTALALGLGGCTSSAMQATSHRPVSARPVATIAPAPTISVASASSVGVISHGSRDRPLVALTFDTNMTDLMAGELDHHQVASFANGAAIDELVGMQVPATLFLAGEWIERYPDITRKLAQNPLFELASHSYAHRPFHAPCYGLGRALPVGQMAADVAHSEALLRSFTDDPTTYFRFPGGCYDDSALAAISSTDVTVIQYDVVSGDAFGRSVRTIVDNVLRHAQNGSIVVMHLTGGNTAPLTAKALPAIVDGLRARGFTLVKLSTLLAPG
jgi:peptidoglycan-N-acetylglucosamine deacetylase